MSKVKKMKPVKAWCIVGRGIHRAILFGGNSPVTYPTRQAARDVVANYAYKPGLYRTARVLITEI
jgi:hypothetical protein